MAGSDAGRVIAVCSSPTSGVPKKAWESIAIESQGVQGDYHAGPINRPKKSGDPKPNLRQVTLVAQEVLDGLNTRLGTILQPGHLGENILVAGLGDLSQLSKGDRLELGTGVVLDVTAQNRPCDTIRVYHPTLGGGDNWKARDRGRSNQFRQHPAGRCLSYRPWCFRAGVT